MICTLPDKFWTPNRYNVRGGTLTAPCNGRLHVDDAGPQDRDQLASKRGALRSAAAGGGAVAHARGASQPGGARAPRAAARRGFCARAARDYGTGRPLNIWIHDHPPDLRRDLIHNAHDVDTCMTPLSTSRKSLVSPRGAIRTRHTARSRPDPTAVPPPRARLLTATDGQAASSHALARAQGAAGPKIAQSSPGACPPAAVPTAAVLKGPSGL